jgi:hypothetical protein
MTCPTAKLDHCHLDPYLVIYAVGTQAFLLKLPPYLLCLHPVFHVSLLEPYKDPTDFHTHAEPDPFELDPGDNSATHIKTIQDLHKISQHFEYLVHFKNSLIDKDTWISLHELPTTANKLINCYHH